MMQQQQSLPISPQAAWKQKTLAVEADKQYQTKQAAGEMAGDRGGEEEQEVLHVIVLYGQALRMLRAAADEPGTTAAIRCAPDQVLRWFIKRFMCGDIFVCLLLLAPHRPVSCSHSMQVCGDEGS